MLARLMLLWSVLISSAFSAEPYLDRWRAVADRLLETPPEVYRFNWGEGVQMIGLMKLYERSGEERYADYVDKWISLYLPRDIKELLRIHTKDPGVKPGYCGLWSPATAALYLYEARQKPEHLELAVKVAEFIRTGAERSPEGGLGHWLGSHQYWVDTLYMACPLLAGLGKLQDKEEYTHDAASQIILFARPLQDSKTGLFYHMWDWQARTRTPDPWGRGDGWVLMSLADTFEAMHKGHRSYAPLKVVADKLARGLEENQDQDGLWHTVLDDAESYAESSASSMICYGLLKLVRLNVLPSSYVPLARRSWVAISERYVKDGVVMGVSAGTSPKGGNYYRSLPQGTRPWGTGAYLMAGSEIDRLR